jgi:hypothetical protein
MQKVATVLTVMAFVVIGCGGKQKVVTNLNNEVVVETSKEKPGWVDNPQDEKLKKEEKERKVAFFQGVVTKTHYLEDANSDARADAMEAVALTCQEEIQYVMEKARTSLSEEEVGRLIKEAQRIISDVLVKELTLEDFYYEKRKNVDEDQVYFRYWALYSVPKGELKKAAETTIEKQRQQQATEEAKKFLDEVKNNLGFSKYFAD